ncbi:MAG: hypothetical protein ACXWKG_03635 [Limisphaerales bacterium]
MKQLLVVVLLAAVLWAVASYRPKSKHMMTHSYHAYGTKSDCRYAWEYDGDPLLEVTDPLCRNLSPMGGGSAGHEQFFLADGTNRLVDLVLDGFWLRGTVEGTKTNLRPGTKIVLQK